MCDPTGWATFNERLTKIRKISFVILIFDGTPKLEIETVETYFSVFYLFNDSLSVEINVLLNDCFYCFVENTTAYYNLKMFLQKNQFFILHC